MLAQSAGLPTSATACFSVRLTTKRTTRRAAIAATVPVFGLRPRRARLARTCHVPKRRRNTGSPCLERLFDRGEDRLHRCFCLPAGCTRVPRQSAGPAPLSACCHAPCHLASRRVLLLHSPPSRGAPSSTGQDRAHVWNDERGQANHRQTGAVKRAAARSREGSRQHAPPAPRWAWLCAAAAHGRLLRGRTAACTGVALYRQMPRVYTQQASERASVPSLVPASVRAHRGGFIKKKFLLKPLRRVLSRTGAVYRHLGGKKFRLYGC